MDGAGVAHVKEVTVLQFRQQSAHRQGKECIVPHDVSISVEVPVVSVTVIVDVKVVPAILGLRAIC